jgi:hypothetical protein
LELRNLDVNWYHHKKYITTTIISLKLFHFPSIIYTNKNIPTFYGQKSSQRILKRCWPTNEESCMGHRKKNRIISSSDLILFFLEIFRKGSQPPSFWTEIPQHIAKNINNNKYTQRSVNCKFGLQSNLIFRVKTTRTTSIEKYFTTWILINLVKDAIVERRLFSITLILLLLVAWLIEN